ncbi:hypothetical protein F6X40_28715 [Paraburkholderia sp. UCT31]|uniref:hypothetical protein n=1 Tax=Paraburkholderia sp. UCT31 TaxID=2615209 RepID=UPI001655AF91|nr:hypothetical protein [Paraburkholderia sp. UCT31]MBC8740617.1 hypothetical protein [Paraburkholderia sp. UCT31]
MTGEDFQKRLDAAFIHEGHDYGRVRSIFEAEDIFSNTALKFSGHMALSNGFKACFLEAVELLNTHCRPLVNAPLSAFYVLFLPRIASAFHTLCAAERAALRGYPRPAFTTLRNVFDDCVLTAAALQKITDFYKIEGIDPTNTDKTTDLVAIKKARKQNEFDVRKLMTGSDSGLGTDITDVLAKIDALYDFEVHGSRLSLTRAEDYMKGEGPLPVLPAFTERDFAWFMNRYNEVAWSLHRLVPAMQPPDAPMPTDWADRWTLVDESFDICARSLTEQLGKKFGDAYADFMKVKFPFTAKSTFPL